MERHMRRCMSADGHTERFSLNRPPGFSREFLLPPGKLPHISPQVSANQHLGKKSKFKFHPTSN